MVAGETGRTSAGAAQDRALPPISELATGSLALIVIGGIYLASYVPRTVPLAPARQPFPFRTRRTCGGTACSYDSGFLNGKDET